MRDLEKGEWVDEESNTKWHRNEGVQSQKWYPYIKQQKKHIQERAYQCTWNNYVLLHENIIIPPFVNVGCLYSMCVQKLNCVSVCDFLPPLI